MAINQQDLEAILKKAFPNSQIELVDLVGDQDHYSVKITDQVFCDKTRVQQHQLVNKALKDLLKDQLHALQIKTLCP